MESRTELSSHVGLGRLPDVLENREKHMASQKTEASYRQSVEQVIQALGTDERRGLSENEARARLGRYGPNELGAEHRVPVWRKSFSSEPAALFGSVHVRSNRCARALEDLQ